MLRVGEVEGEVLEVGGVVSCAVGDEDDGAGIRVGVVWVSFVGGGGGGGGKAEVRCSVQVRGIREDVA